MAEPVYTVVITVAGFLTEEIALGFAENMKAKLRAGMPASLAINAAVTDDPVTA